MTDSYMAPTDLADARAKMARMVDGRCRAVDADPAGEGVVVTLVPGPLASQRHLITDRTVVVVADLVLWRWSSAELQALADALSEPDLSGPPTRSLVFLEPTADLGWRRAVHRIGAPVWRRTVGHDFEADVPAIIRSTGLVVTTQDRFGLGPSEARSYVRGEARQYRNRP